MLGRPCSWRVTVMECDLFKLNHCYIYEWSLVWAEGPRLGFEPDTHIWDSDKEVSAVLYNWGSRAFQMCAVLDTAGSN